MIRFIPLSAIKSALNDAPLESLMKGDEAAEKEVMANLSQDFSEKDINEALTRLKVDGATVFHGWIAQHPTLENFMNSGKIDQLELTATVQNHTLFHQFQKFVTTYLQEQLLSVHPENDKETADLFSFVCLLTEDVRDVVEAQLFQSIHGRVKALLKNADNLGDLELQGAVSSLLSDPVISSLNSLSKAMYHEKVFFVESFLELIRSGMCTPRLSNWILKQLDQLKLNKEHNDKLLDIRSDLKSGKIQGLKSVAKTRSVINPVKLIGGLLSVGVIVVLFFYFFKNGENEVNTISSNSSFKTYTKEERAQMDSIIKILQAKHNNSYFNIDTTSSGQLIMPSYLSMRRSFDNQLMERIYEDWNKDGILQDLYAATATKETSNISRRQGEKPLNTKLGKIKVSLVNESAYSLVLYAGKNEPNANVYSLYIPQDTTVELLLDEGDVFFCVAGRSLQKFEAPGNVTPDLLPDFDFKEHFGSTDNNYIESMNRPYFVKRTATTLKILVTGNKRDYFAITELDGVLEAY